MNAKTSAFIITFLSFLNPVSVSYAQSAADAYKGDTDDSSDSSSLMIIKREISGGLSELDTPAAVSVVDGDAQIEHGDGSLAHDLGGQVTEHGHAQHHQHRPDGQVQAELTLGRQSCLNETD